GDPNSRTGAPVTTASLDGDAKADILVGNWVGAGGQLLAYTAASLLGGGTLTPLFDLLSNPGSLLPGLIAPVSPPTVPPTPTPGDALVTLQLNPLDINLLGLKIATSPITVTVSAEEGSGKLLGNALTLASHLVNLPGVSSA